MRGVRRGLSRGGGVRVGGARGGGIGGIGGFGLRGGLRAAWRQWTRGDLARAVLGDGPA